MTDEKLADAYREAYDKCAGPEQFRHSVNHDFYHAAGLRAVFALANQSRVERIATACLAAMVGSSRNFYNDEKEGIETAEGFAIASIEYANPLIAELDKDAP